MFSAGGASCLDSRPARRRRGNRDPGATRARSLAGRGRGATMLFRSTELTNHDAEGGRSALATAAREALAFARQGWLLRHDTSEPVIPRDVAPGDDVVVFLHGLFATAGVLRPLRAAVARHPFVHTATFTYLPGP